MRKLLILLLLSIPAWGQIPGYNVPDSGVGLTVCIGPGSNNLSGAVVNFAGSCLGPFSLGSTTFGYLDVPTGNLLTNTTGVPAQGCPIFEADTNQFAVIAVRDKRLSVCSGQTKTYIDLTANPYFASCATVGPSTVTVNGPLVQPATQVSVANTAGFQVGQAIFINGAGTTGYLYTGQISAISGNTFTITPATATTIGTGLTVNGGIVPVTTTTNGPAVPGTSIPLTSAATFSKGQGIYIAGAGASSANYTGTITAITGNTVTVTPATSTLVTNATVQHDETNAINTAISNLGYTTLGGAIKMPPGICLVNGALQSIGGGLSAVIPLPDIQYNDATGINGPVVTISLEGASPPSRVSNNLNGWLATATTQGTIIQTAVASNNLIAAYSVLGTDHISSVQLRLKNLIFRTGTNPAITMINCLYCAEFITEGSLQIDTMAAGGTQNFPPQPTNTNGIGLIVPSPNNDGFVDIENISISGFFKGMTWNEHIVVRHAILLANWIGISCDYDGTVFHKGVGLYVDVEQNAYGIKPSVNNCYMNIVNLDSEANATFLPSWVTGAPGTAILSDTGNALIGTIGVGMSTKWFTRQGGDRVNFTFLDQIPKGPYGLTWSQGFIGVTNINSTGSNDPNTTTQCSGTAFLVIPPQVTAAQTGANGCVGLGFNFTGQTVAVRVPVVLNANANATTAFDIGNDSANALHMRTVNGNLDFYKKIGGAFTLVGTTTYNPSSMLWWRLSESSGAVTASTSPDGITWTTLATCAATCVSWSYTNTNVEFQISCGNGACATPPGYAQWDSWQLNTTPTPSRVTTTDGLFGSAEFRDASACETSFGATTLSTGGTTTNTGLNCLPANAIIDAVVYRITTTITTAASFTIGDGSTAARFCSTQSTLTAGTTGVCIVPWTSATAGTMGQVSAAAVRVTTNANPGAGAIRLIVYYHSFTAPTS